MENVILTIHLILALLLIGVVLLQRSEGGGLGMGSGGGGGAMSGRAAASALTRLTWIFAIAFIITSVALTLLAAKNSTGSSVIDQIGGTARAPAPALPLTVPGSDLTLPPAPATAPLTPPRVDGGAATAPAPATAGN
ncbi:MAG: preprotein translocase subunit SecG [Pseudorhodobacter sp.]|nr:preprotein translocase subunit SecG [Pseudorhodobacter sp.]